jgi:CHAT domain-containing protein/tetratricopeptide (TPR) repeat protein
LVLLGAAIAATGALAQSPAAVHAGAPVATSLEGRHCALHPRFDGPLALVTGAALPAAAAPAVAVLVDASGQVMLVDGPIPGTSKLRDSTEPPDSDIAELGELVTEAADGGYAARFRFRYERIECRVAGAVRFAPSSAAERDVTLARTLRLLDASLAIREVDRLRGAGDAKAALPIAEQAIATRRAALGAEHRHTLNALDRRGSLEWDLGEHKAAAATLSEAYERLVATLGAGHPDAYGTLQNLALAHWDLGELERADVELRDAIEGRKRLLDADDLDLLGTQLNLATLQGELGDLGEAQATLEQLFRTYEGKVGPDHPTTLLLLNNLAGIYRELGRYDDELRLRELACGRYVRALGDKHPATLRCRHNLAFALFSTGRKEDAMAVAHQAWDDRVAVLGPTHPETLYSMQAYAQTLADNGRVGDGLALQRQLLSIRRETRGPEHPETLQALTVLARLEALGGDAPAARSNARAAYDAFAALRPRSPETMIALGRLATVEADMGERAAAIEHYRVLVAMVEDRRRVQSLSAESQRTAFAVWVAAYKRLVSLLVEAGATADAFRQLELSKARGLLEMLAHRRAESASGLTRDEQVSLRMLERRIESLDEAIARLRGDPAERVKVEAERTAAARELGELRAALRASHPKYAQLTGTTIVDASAARDLLARDAALVSYLVDGPRVRAFVVDRRGEPRAFDLGAHPRLADSVGALRTLIAPRDGTPAVVWRRADGSFVASLARTAPDDVRVTDAGELTRALGRMLVEPLEGALAGRTRVLLSPDGALALVPFEALSTSRGRVLERYRVSYVQSLSVLALVTERTRGRARAAERRDLMAMGAARYEPSGAPAAVPVRNAAVAVGQLAVRDATPEATQRAYDSLGLAWRPLPGAKREIDTVARLFAAPPRDLHVDANATETRLRALDASGELMRYRHLLFAAHGYLSTEAPALSALVLGRDPADPASDGYVTVAEWVGYRLASDLVVLSACDTGVGRDIQGEGVMGLPFALFVAGNRNAVLSLWPVYDEGTAEFMRRFFARVHRGEAHADALAATKRSLAREARYAAPAHWAGFVLYGD